MRLHALAVAALALGLLAQAPNLKLDREYAKLSAKAQHDTAHKRAEDLARLAELDYAYADAGFRAGNPTLMLRKLDQASAHAGQADDLLAAEAARGKTDGMKNVEQSLQRITYNLRGLALEAPLPQRPAVSAMASHFSDLRAQVLNWMFAPKR